MLRSPFHEVLLKLPLEVTVRQPNLPIQSHSPRAFPPLHVLGRYKDSSKKASRTTWPTESKHPAALYSPFQQFDLSSNSASLEASPLGPESEPNRAGCHIVQNSLLTFQDRTHKFSVDGTLGPLVKFPGHSKLDSCTCPEAATHQTRCCQALV